MLRRNGIHHRTSAGQGRAGTVKGMVSAEEIAIALTEDGSASIHTLLHSARRVTYEPHDVLYHQGYGSDTVCFITRGLLKLVSHLPNGRARIVRLHRPGSVLGLSGLRGHCNEHTAIAVTSVSALHVPLGTIQQLRTEDPRSYVCLLERWHDYLRDADTWIVQFSTGPIRGRVARLLEFLGHFEPGATGGCVDLLTCEEMASILGVTGESVSRILADFKRKRILSHNRNQRSESYDADLYRLRKIANEDE
jgi:CRP/FNR family transcriptional regulator, anaerobic regulatory protein